MERVLYYRLKDREMKCEGIMFHSVKTRTIATFLVIVVLVIIVSAAVSFVLVDRQQQDDNESLGRDAAMICAVLTEYAVTDLDTFKPGSPDYDGCCDSLRSLCRVEDMAYMYVYTVDEENGTMTYIMAVSGDPERDALISKARPYGTVVNIEHLGDDTRDAMQCKNGLDVAKYDNDFGKMVDCFVPVGRTGMYAASSYSLSAQTSKIVMTTIGIVVHIIFALLLLLIGQLVILQRDVMKPLQKISKRMKEFDPQDARSFEPVGITTKDELGKIASSFESMAGNIAHYLGDIEQMAEERAQVSVEMDVARRIQQGMVPASSKADGDFASVYAFSRSAKDVGGDFYDVIEREDGSTAIVIGDVSGKGVAAALFMAMSKEAIGIELSEGNDPASTLMSVNRRLCNNNPEGMFVTALVALMEPDGHVTFANAGHLRPVRVLGEAEEVECDTGGLMGLFDDTEIVNETLELAPGEALLLYTDGASEAVNAKKEFLGNATIREQLSNRTPFSDVRDLIDELVGVVDGFAAQAEQFDDLTAVALMRKADGDPSSPAEEGEETAPRCELEVSLSSFKMVRDDIMAGTGEPIRRKACLACEEVFANIVSYSNANRIFYSVSEHDGRLVIVLEDDGVPFDPLMADPLEKEFEELDSGGMGIAIVKEIADEVSYQRNAGCNVLTLEFDLDSESK